jgi:putative MFS transporter
METSMTSAGIAARLERLPLSNLHRRLLLIHGFGWLFDAMDVGIVTFVLAALARDWHLRPNQIGLIGSAGLAGMFVGAVLAGVAADRWGRRAVFQSTLLIYSIMSFFCALSPNVTFMAAFRFLVGVGLGGELPVVASLLSEFVPKRHREQYIIYLESFWAFGWFVAALVAFLLIPKYGWQAGFIVGVFPALYIWIIRRNLPESPRWYESKGRFEEAEATMQKLERESERVTQTRLEPMPAFSKSNLANQNPSAFRDLWRKPYVRNTVMLWIVWFCLIFGYYGIFVWLPTMLVKSGYSLVSSFRYVVFITAAQIPGYYSAAKLVKRFECKTVISVYLTASAIAAYLFGHASDTYQILLWACLMSFFNLGAWGAVYAYTPALYPTRIRATGAGWATAFGRIGGILAPSIVGLLLGSIGREGVLTINAGMWLVAAVAVGLLGIPTKGRPLPEEQ